MITLPGAAPGALHRRHGPATPEEEEEADVTFIRIQERAASCDGDVLRRIEERCREKM